MKMWRRPCEASTMALYSVVIIYYSVNYLRTRNEIHLSHLSRCPTREERPELNFTRPGVGGEEGRSSGNRPQRARAATRRVGRRLRVGRVQGRRVTNPAQRTGQQGPPGGHGNGSSRGGEEQGREGLHEQATKQGRRRGRGTSRRRQLRGGRWRERGERGRCGRTIISHTGGPTFVGGVARRG